MASIIFERYTIMAKASACYSIHCDNQTAISRTQNFIYNGKSTHIRHRHNTIKQLLSNGIISIDFVSSKDNLIDLFTKSLSGERINCASKENESKSLTLSSQLNENPT